MISKFCSINQLGMPQDLVLPPRTSCDPLGFPGNLIPSFLAKLPSLSIEPIKRRAAMLKDVENPQPQYNQ